MSTPWTGNNKIFGAVMALIGVILSTMLVVAVRRDELARAADFGSPPTTAAAPTTARPQPPEPAPPPAAANTTEAPDRLGSSRVPEPQELLIPRLDLRAPVDSVGVTDDGLMEVPPDPDRVGWYRFSPAPGSAAGSSVVVGHVDAKGRGLGVLNALNEVRQGDRVLVERKDGSTIAYEITERRTVGKKALADSEAFRRDGRSVLTLITCTGPYLSDAGGYQNNLVVTAAEATR
ncbi:class F sortase [Streptomyces sp. NPDC004266]|uniref:class F sortase n=1 Tax=Streptomyces sp. NPDC004266 TaxID=3364693 RepID=UPI0036B6A478